MSHRRGQNHYRVIVVVGPRRGGRGLLTRQYHETHPPHAALYGTTAVPLGGTAAATTRAGRQNSSGELIAWATMTSGGSGAPPTEPMKACRSGSDMNFWNCSTLSHSSTIRTYPSPMPNRWCSPHTVLDA